MPALNDLPRCFLPAGSLSGESLRLTGEALHHLGTVLRLQTGDRALLLDGTGACCLVCFGSVTRQAAEARVEKRWSFPETARPLLLQQVLPKADKFDLVLQKGTELGIQAFQPVVSERSLPRYEPDRLAKRSQRWAKIIREAARQSRRYILPVLEPLRTLDEALAITRQQLRLVLWEQAQNPLDEVLPAQSPQDIALLVGPEGGFSTAEILRIEKAGYLPVHLGPRILRTETAGLAAAAILQYRYGDLNHAPQSSEETP